MFCVGASQIGHLQGEWLAWLCRDATDVCLVCVCVCVCVCVRACIALHPRIAHVPLDGCLHGTLRQPPSVYVSVAGQPLACEAQESGDAQPNAAGSAGRNHPAIQARERAVSLNSLASGKRAPRGAPCVPGHRRCRAGRLAAWMANAATRASKKKQDTHRRAQVHPVPRRQAGVWLAAIPPEPATFPAARFADGVEVPPATTLPRA